MLVVDLVEERTAEVVLVFESFRAGLLDEIDCSRTAEVVRVLFVLAEAL